ncbi:MAG: hypothetical protein HFJ79_01335 [Clostridiales bacterium]|nr:hypothetical protein [Clostridiales bacterium]
MKNRNKAATAATAVVLSAALLMTGTFAWNDFSQKKLNELAGVLNYDVALVEDFEETSDWSFANPDVNKDVSAANKGDNAAYVRINLREYLQVRPFTYTNDSYVKDAEGNPVRFAVDKNGEYIPSTAADPKAFGVDFSGDIGVKYFVVAQGADQTIATMDSTNENGQIGKFMINPALPDGGKVYADDKVEHYGADKKAATTDEEMAYAIHKFTDTPDPWQTKVEEYVNWKMGPAVKTMAEYKTLSADDKKDAKFWIVDTDGWCYWSQPLAKDEQTTLLLDAATLKKAPKGDLYYAIHSTMQAVDKENLGWWAADATEDAKDTILPDLNGGTVTPIRQITNITLDKNTLELTDATPSKLTATVTPDDATEKTIKWKSSDPTVATVDQEGNVTACGQGTTSITANAIDGSNVSGECVVTVPKWVPVQGIKVNTSITLQGTNSNNLTVTFTPNDATDKRLLWESSDPSIVTVDDNGKITGVSAGKTNVTVTSVNGGFTSRCQVTVNAVSATSITFANKSSDATNTGGYVQQGSIYQSLKAVPQPENTTDIPIWSSSDSSILTVDSKTGEITAVGSVGQEAVITAKSGNKSAQIKLKIVKETIVMGTDPNTKVPITWIVMEKKAGEALVIAESVAVSDRAFDTSGKDGSTIWWGNSTLRTYLNDTSSKGFIGSAFTAEEKSRILTTPVKTYDKYIGSGSEVIQTTNDKLFLLCSFKTTGVNYCTADYADWSSYAPINSIYFMRNVNLNSGKQSVLTLGKTGAVNYGFDFTATASIRPVMRITMPD